MEKSSILKLEDIDRFEVEFEVEKYYGEEIAYVDTKIIEKQREIDALNKEIDRLTNHADGLDYTVAVVSGVFCGLIDAIFVDEFSFENAQNMGDEKMKKFVKKVAKLKGYKGDDLSQAVRFLEQESPIAADKATNIFGGGKQHHLRDFSHHPTFVGLVFSLLTQFTQNVYGTDTSGHFIVEHLDLKNDDLKLIGKNLPEKLTFGVINWVFHMVSDVIGSSTSVRAEKYGTGLPGPIVSLLKEISSLPIFKSKNSAGNKELSVWISKLFNGTLLGKKDSDGKLKPIQFDLRTELGVLMQLGKQALPVLLNECIVRGFYFIRRLLWELKRNKISNIEELKNIEWANTLPIKNRTIVRMVTIASGTFSAVDIIDAAIRSGGFNPSMILHVNFVGVGRFCLAIGSDMSMGIKRQKRISERISVTMQQLDYIEAKVFYMHAGNWIEIKNTEKKIIEAYESCNEYIVTFLGSMQNMNENLKEIEKDVKQIKKNDAKFIEDCLDILD